MANKRIRKKWIRNHIRQLLEMCTHTFQGPDGRTITVQMNVGIARESLADFAREAFRNGQHPRAK